MTIYHDGNTDLSQSWGDLLLVSWWNLEEAKILFQEDGDGGEDRMMALVTTTTALEDIGAIIILTKIAQCAIMILIVV